MRTITFRGLVGTLIAVFVVLSAIVLDTPRASAQTANLVGLQLGAISTPGPWSCNRSVYQFWGNVVYTPNITGGWSGTALKAPCMEYMVFYNQNMGQQDYFELIKLYLAKLTIPTQKDVRVCIEEVNGSTYGGATCTPWASEATSENSWLTSPDTTGGDDPDGLRLKVETRDLVGRSVTDMKIHYRLGDYCAPNGALAGYWNVYGPWAETKWRSELAGTGEWGPSVRVTGCQSANFAQIALRVRMSAWNTADLTATTADHTVVPLGQPQPMSYSVQNTGVVVSGVSQAEVRFDYKRDGWDGNGVDGDFSISQATPAIAAAGSVAATVNATFNAEGSWRVQVVSDALAAVTETSEANNTSAWDDFIVDAVPTAVLSASINGSASSTSDQNMVVGNNVVLSWTSANADSCTGSDNGSGTFNVGGLVGSDPTISVLEGITAFTLTCSTVHGLTVTDTLTLTATAPAIPVVSLQVVGGDTTVPYGNAITLEWSAPNDVTECTAVEFTLVNPTGGDAVNGEKSGIIPGVDETTYTYMCRYGTGAWGTDSVTVTTYNSMPSLTAISTRVREGEDIVLNWDTSENDPTGCSLVGPGLTRDPVTVDPFVTTGTETLTAAGSGTYTLSCPGGNAVVNITMIPRVYES